jgi:ubiquinone biosynthesis monooxygenase Coq7
MPGRSFPNALDPRIIGGILDPKSSILDPNAHLPDPRLRPGASHALGHGRVVARDPEIRERYARAAREEEDHLAWTQSRLAEMDARPSLLNPLWYAGSFAIGLAAGFGGDRSNLGFVVETERQVEEHLTTHMDRLPAADVKSRAIVEQMRDDEARHGAMALEAGGLPLPFPIRRTMRAAADVMRAVAYRI